MLALPLAPQGYLGCAHPLATDHNPDGTWTLTLCRRPMAFAMPGGGGDAPGWIVLRDAEGAIRGVVDLGLVQMYGNGQPPVWSADTVVVQLTAEIPLHPASGPWARWTEDRAWRLRALLSLTPTDDQFR